MRDVLVSGHGPRPVVTVYSTPDCAQCRLTSVALAKAGIAYTVVDLALDPAARRYVTQELGHATAPVVVVEGDPPVHWSGFRRDRIAALADEVAGG